MDRYRRLSNFSERGGFCGQDWYVNPVGSEGAGRSLTVAAWYDEHVDSLFGYVARRIGRDTAADVVGDVFRLALERFDTFDPAKGTERAWLFGIATNLVRRHWRCEERALRAITRSVALDRGWAGDGIAGIEDRIDATRYVSRLMEAVIRLPADDRDLLVLVAWEGWPHGEVARVLDIPEGTVRSRLHRIRRQLSTATGGVTT